MNYKETRCHLELSQDIKLVSSEKDTVPFFLSEESSTVFCGRLTRRLIGLGTIAIGLRTSGTSRHCNVTHIASQQAI